MKHYRPIVIMTQSRAFERDSSVLSLVHTPLITTEALPFDETVFRCHYDWLVLTSRNAVQHFLPHMKKARFDRVATIGRKTSERLEQEGLKIDFEPGDYSQEGFLADFPAWHGTRILYPASREARPLLHDHLVAAGCAVERLDLYRPVANEAYREEIQALLAQSPYGITFSSPSGVRAFMKWFTPQDLGNITVVAIGQVTADALGLYGVASIQPGKETLEEMVELLEDRIDGGV
ncbi:uroporphyrinogen-III synthase [Salinicoccus sp. ID82-1]|uniref:uroporphyrinogen-III synthase n=1 Tax=Salinicoccus sp. ID82-1 TaxID=2820269 RepID=UPI001F464EC3|nr:uroporphyrinogen-III synthase [Salinicoccus sp. ID82-1]MCG1009193.1 uroporphyrinogen-III synthase [Salinicoccus sp. ID82-1]